QQKAGVEQRGQSRDALVSFATTYEIRGAVNRPVADQNDCAGKKLWKRPVMRSHRADDMDQPDKVVEEGRYNRAYLEYKPLHAQRHHNYKCRQHYGRG